MTRDSPTPEAIRAARDAAGLSSAQAGALLHTTGRVFQQWAAGERRMHPAFWELFRIKLSTGSVKQDMTRFWLETILDNANLSPKGPPTP